MTITVNITPEVSVALTRQAAEHGRALERMPPVCSKMLCTPPPHIQRR